MTAMSLGLSECGASVLVDDQQDGMCAQWQVWKRSHRPTTGLHGGSPLQQAGRHRPATHTQQKCTEAPWRMSGDSEKASITVKGPHAAVYPPAAYLP